MASELQKYLPAREWEVEKEKHSRVGNWPWATKGDRNSGTSSHLLTIVRRKETGNKK